MSQENKESQILAAAEDEFLTVGYDRAKTVSIAAKAGVTHAMLHYYFRTKENLFNKVFDSKIELMYKMITSIFVEKDMPIMDRVESGIRAHFQLLVENAKLPQFVTTEIIGKKERIVTFQERLKPMINSFIPLVQAEFDQLYEKGKIAKVSAVDILQDMIFLNVSTFIFEPMFNGLLFSEAEKKQYLENRLNENIILIKNRLKYGVK